MLLFALTLFSKWHRLSQKNVCEDQYVSEVSHNFNAITP